MARNVRAKRCTSSIVIESVKRTMVTGGRSCEEGCVRSKEGAKSLSPEALFIHTVHGEEATSTRPSLKASSHARIQQPFVLLLFVAVRLSAGKEGLCGLRAALVLLSVAGEVGGTKRLSPRACACVDMSARERETEIKREKGCVSRAPSQHCKRYGHCFASL